MKKKINNIAKEFKEESEYIFKLLKRVGEYNQGHMYGLPKLHKNIENPPLRPIISMTGTVTHDIAQYINSLIRPYLCNNYTVKSSEEFIARINDIKIKRNQNVVSLDVQSLFTNVPVHETTDIILNAVENHDTLPPPALPPAKLRELLTICTTETPFQFNNQTYIQTNGVSMGSPLGPTYADFYMEHLENDLLLNANNYNPCLYLRYVDDIFAIFDSKNNIKEFISNLESHSVLKFDVEFMNGKVFNFLDVKLTLNDRGTLCTSVYIKPTDKGLYSNFQSHTPLRYKKSILRALFNRAVKHSHSWIDFHTEANRIKSVFSNNNYPQHLVENVLQSVLNKHFSNSHVFPNENDIKYFIKLDNISTFTSDEKTIKQIINRHVSSVNIDNNVTVSSYFKPKKLSSSFSTRPKKPLAQRTNVVYSFDCKEGSCQASYIGYTTNSVLTRCKQHRYNPSSIYRHYSYDHQMRPPVADTLINNFKVIYSSHNVVNLKIAESLLIKEHNPFINVKYNESHSFLTLF